MLQQRAAHLSSLCAPEVAGLLLQACSTLLATVMGSFVKAAVHRGVPVFEAVLARSAVVLAFACSLLCRSRHAPWRSQWRGMLLLRGLLGFGAVSCLYWAVALLPLSDAAALGFLAPLLVALAAPLLLGEPLSWAPVVAIPFALVGVVLVARPTFLFVGGPALPLAGIAVGIVQALLMACAKMSIRWLARAQEPVASIIFIMAFVSVLGSLALCLALPGQALVAPPGAAGWALLLGAGCMGVGVQLTATHALRLARAAPAVAMGYLSVLWGLCADVAVFRAPPSGAALAGAALICACSLGVVLEQSRGGGARGAASGLQPSSGAAAGGSKHLEVGWRGEAGGRGGAPLELAGPPRAAAAEREPLLQPGIRK